MGVEVRPMDEVLARQFRVPDGTRGAFVNGVLPGSPAEAAGLRRGDVIKSFGGRPVGHPRDLTDVVARARPGAKVPIRVVRDGRALEPELTVGEMPQPRDLAEAPEKEPAPSTWEGAQLRTVTAELARALGLPERSGVLVTGVEPGGAASQAGLAEGDVIRSVDRAPTPDVAAFLKAVGAADPEAGLLFDVNRGGRLIYLTYRKPAA
jgi:serine protease Do